MFYVFYWTLITVKLNVLITILWSGTLARGCNRFINLCYGKKYISLVASMRVMITVLWQPKRNEHGSINKMYLYSVRDVQLEVLWGRKYTAKDIKFLTSFGDLCVLVS